MLCSSSKFYTPREFTTGKMAPRRLLFMVIFFIVSPNHSESTVYSKIIQKFEVRPLSLSFSDEDVVNFNPEVLTSNPSKCLFPADCSEVQSCDHNKSGVYRVFPLGAAHEILVFCDMITDGGGWLVFQRRQDGGVDFNRNWQSFKDGFGNLYREFWLGLGTIHLLTSFRQTELMINLGRFDGATGFAKYKRFRVASEQDMYRLLVGKYSGNVENALKGGNGMNFSTFDRDQDAWSNNCAQHYHGAWWHNKCFYCHLNGYYLQKGTDRGKLPEEAVLSWKFWTGKWEALQFAEMKMRPVEI